MSISLYDVSVVWSVYEAWAALAQNLNEQIVAQGTKYEIIIVSWKSYQKDQALNDLGFESSQL